MQVAPSQRAGQTVEPMFCKMGQFQFINVLGAFVDPNMCKAMLGTVKDMKMLATFFGA